MFGLFSSFLATDTAASKWRRAATVAGNQPDLGGSLSPGPGVASASASIEKLNVPGTAEAVPTHAAAPISAVLDNAGPAAELGLLHSDGHEPAVAGSGGISSGMHASIASHDCTATPRPASAAKNKVQDISAHPIADLTASGGAGTASDAAGTDIAPAADVTSATGAREFAGNNSCNANQNLPVAAATDGIRGKATNSHPVSASLFVPHMLPPLGKRRGDGAIQPSPKAPEQPCNLAMDPLAANLGQGSFLGLFSLLRASDSSGDNTEGSEAEVVQVQEPQQEQQKQQMAAGGRSPNATPGESLPVPSRQKGDRTMRKQARAEDRARQAARNKELRRRSSQSFVDARDAAARRLAFQQAVAAREAEVCATPSPSRACNAGV